MRVSKNSRIHKNDQAHHFLPYDAIDADSLSEAIDITIDSCEAYYPHEDWKRLRNLDWQKHSNELCRRLKDAFTLVKFDPVIDDIRVRVVSNPFKMSIIGCRGSLNGRGTKLFKPRKNSVCVQSTSFLNKLETVTQASVESLGYYAEMPLSVILLVYTVERICKETPSLICYSSEITRYVHLIYDGEFQSIGYIHDGRYERERSGLWMYSLLKSPKADLETLSSITGLSIDEADMSSGRWYLVYGSDQRNCTHSFSLSSKESPVEMENPRLGRFSFNNENLPIRSELESKALKLLRDSPISNRFNCAQQCKVAVSELFDYVTSKDYIDDHRQRRRPYLPATLYLLDLGNNRVKVMAYLRKLLNMGLQEVRAFVSEERPEIVSGANLNVEMIKGQLDHLGAETEIVVEEEDFQEFYDCTPPLV